MSKDFKVKDLALADFGRKEISLAETEMPGLMALRKEAFRISHQELRLRLHLSGSRGYPSISSAEYPHF